MIRRRLRSRRADIRRRHTQVGRFGAQPPDWSIGQRVGQRQVPPGSQKPVFRGAVLWTQRATRRFISGPTARCSERVWTQLTHRPARPRAAVADLHVAVEEDVGVGAAHKFKHLHAERGVCAVAVLQDPQSLQVLQQRTAEERNRPILINESPPPPQTA